MWVPTSPVIAMLALIVLAGCIGDPGDPDPRSGEGQDEGFTPGPQAVVALVDTGINPYHEAFRDDSPLGQMHPSEYLPDYPEDAVTIELTLDADNLEEALGEDQEIWDSIEPETLYWFKGTKIVGGYTTTDGEIFDTGHGTMVASRAASNDYSLCPECRIASVQGFTGDSVRWAGEQPWIDAQSNSWSPLGGVQQLEGVVWEEDLSEAFEEAATKQLVFASGGNGLTGQFGIVGQPTFTRSTSGPTGVIAVGGYDNGEVVLWSGSVPYIAADACRNWAAIGDSIDEHSSSAGGGTSSASPYAMGGAARILLEARTLLADTSTQARDETVFAQGNATGEALEGPLADGTFTLDEAKDLLLRTAQPRPEQTEHDGDTCHDFPLYNTIPVAWEDIPQDVPQYYLIGWGGINVHSLELALNVTAGNVAMPERSDTQGWHENVNMLRETYNGLRDL